MRYYVSQKTQDTFLIRFCLDYMLDFTKSKHKTENYIQTKEEADILGPPQITTNIS